MNEAATATVPSTMTAARLTDVSKLYGSFAALRRVTVEFPVGSSTMIVGDNGAGKSTLLRVVAGMITPSMGRIEAFGDLPHRQRKRIAYMSHDTMLYDELSGMENLKYFAALQRHGGIACSCTASPEMALRAVGLDPKMTRPVGQYSQGMRQRASLARVLQTDPELLLLDEPFSNLDIESANNMVELLEDFLTWPVNGQRNGHGTHARTIILTTHQPKLAESLAERTLTMKAGAVVSLTERTSQTADRGVR
ncbi:MAG TPA: ABC transporter ATP-binding protein [Acidobacteriaceae bacterium]|nr:ABC transporter ATP-binding protein [Acidobacteriaceae bacterium]